MMLTTPTITTDDHPDLPAILVYIECLCALEVHTYIQKHILYMNVGHFQSFCISCPWGEGIGGRLRPLSFPLNSQFLCMFADLRILFVLSLA